MVETTIHIRGTVLHADLNAATGSRGIVIFAHGSGSGRFSPRNQYVAKELQKNGFATLLADLLTQEEERIDAVTQELRFDIPLLASRVAELTEWVRRHPVLGKLSIMYFGASTGAAAALIAATTLPKEVAAIVSRGGRPDLAGRYLEHVKAPTLLVVGGNDTGVIALNEHAMQKLTCKKKLAIVPGATHLFEEPGALEEVVRLAVAWFTRYGT